MKIGIYSPYLDTIGGGERYMLTIAESLSKTEIVDVFLDSHLQTLDVKKIISKNQSLLNLDLSAVNFTNAPFGRNSSLYKRANFLKNYDLIFYLTDGSIFYSTAKKSILHIQSPIKVTNTSLWKKIKQSSWDLVIYNSKFTKSNSDKYWKIKSEVVYPPVNVNSLIVGKKKKKIVTVGRFFAYTKDKKHQVMIDAFKSLVDTKKISDWSLYLVGGAGDGDAKYVNELKDLSKNYPIKILENLPYSELKKVYSEASIYWHAAGYGEKDPTKMEHFGITTVEAMASGCVPVVVNLGGQKEIVEMGANGYLWDTVEELKKYSLKLIDSPKLLEQFSKKSQKSVEKFSKEEFVKKIKSLI